MEITILCTVIASIRVLPNRSQFFLYESLSLSCGGPEESSQWRVIRNISIGINEECPIPRNKINESNCFIDDVYPYDTGVYWCESEGGRCSNAINITVTDGPVILESPALPVMEGDDVTLNCTDMNSSSTLIADFYKDGFLLATSSTGNMTIHSVSESDEGFYSCNIAGVGQSLDSWLAVRGRPEPPEPPESLLACILLPVVGFCVLLVSLTLLWRRHKDNDVSYSNVIITQGMQPKRTTDAPKDASIFYSTLNLTTT